MDISPVLRIMAFVLLLISLIVMVADKTRSNVLFSFSDNSNGLKYSFSTFEAFRFVVAANVIGFLYSFIRIILGFCPTIGSILLYVSFILDQIMAYMLLSSSSAGIAYIMFIRDSFEGQEAYGAGEKKFVRYAAASVSMEFLGFLVMAASAVISTHNLLRYLRSPKCCSVPCHKIPADNTDSRQQDAASVCLDLVLDS
ncbi:hypothetical protein SUGI_0478490 [Cryptomeria japonica]|uniref:CASP-like protein 4A2 n=1 Tax=Cryptomeria japonica TaxID=3369 RepID=UPI002408B0B7|nr:CASP-like protein 4A2 [Cryptomeria japonica]GLJ24993.1 hypothetical protein SUGI_0478490 [Cryptomeria japonica]